MEKITNDDIFADIVASIEGVAEAVNKMKTSKLKQKAIIILIQAQTKMSMSDIEKVLDAAADLKKTYLK